MNWHQQLSADLLSAEDAHLRRRRNILEGAQGPQVRIGEERLTNFCSNDYLGFANHPKLIEASIEAAKKWGVGSGASHLVCGHQQLAEQFEQDFAKFVGAESALLFSTGYMANFAVVNSFFDRDGLILQDKSNHASLIDAGRLSRAKFSRYAHSDMSALQKQLSDAGDQSALIASDAVFSMEGDIAPLQEISDLAQSHNALAYFDDAHGFGVLGDQGRGSLNAVGLAPTENRILLSTLGKAMGSFGAVVTGDKVFIDTLIQKARPYIYTTALPPHVIAASAAGLGLMLDEDWRFAHLQRLIQIFRTEAKAIGLQLLNSTTPIQPILIGDNQKTLACSERLRELGFLVTAIRPPTVPEGSARLRITLSAAHSEDQIGQLLEALSALKKMELL